MTSPDPSFDLKIGSIISIRGTQTNPHKSIIFVMWLYLSGMIRVKVSWLLKSFFFVIIKFNQRIKIFSVKRRLKTIELPKSFPVGRKSQTFRIHMEE